SPYRLRADRELHSFPTRRSSDLWQDVYALLRRSCDVLIVETPHPDEDDTGARVVAETKHRIDPLWERMEADGEVFATTPGPNGIDRKSTRLNSSHVKISYAVFCL